MFSNPGAVIAIAGVVLLIVSALAARPLLAYFRQSEVEQGIARFRLRREMLEARFVELASRAGKPRGLIWSRCEWLDQVTFARDLETGLLTAFVGVEVCFEAEEGSDMEEVEAVGTIRDASAVFHYRNGQWGTGGKALFNMNPQDALIRLEGQFEPIRTGRPAGRKPG